MSISSDENSFWSNLKHKSSTYDKRSSFISTLNRFFVNEIDRRFSKNSCSLSSDNVWWKGNIRKKMQRLSRAVWRWIMFLRTFTFRWKCDSTSSTCIFISTIVAKKVKRIKREWLKCDKIDAHLWDA